MAKITPLHQVDDSSCWPTSIYMALQYLWSPYSFDDIAEISQYLQKDWLTNNDLVSTLKLVNVSVREIKWATWDDIYKNNTDYNVIIVSWMLHGYIWHFSVVDAVDENFIMIADPDAWDIIKIDRIVFMRLWMDYDEVWFPEKNTDIQLRWMCVISRIEPSTK